MNKCYTDPRDRNVIYTVRAGIGNERYMAEKCRFNGMRWESWHRVRSPKLPVVMDRSVAEEDLAVYAAKHGLIVCEMPKECEGSEVEG